MKGTEVMEPTHEYTDAEAKILMTAILHNPDDEFCMSKWAEELKAYQRDCINCMQIIVVQWPDDMYVVFDYPKNRRLPKDRALIARYHEAKAMQADLTGAK